MAVAHDAASESHTGTTGSVSEASFSWTHTPAGTPAGVLVFVVNHVTDANLVSSVTYGGGNVPAVVGGEASDAETEPGRTNAFFLGSSVPTGAQTVVVNRTNNTDELWAVCVTVTAAADTEITGVVLLQGDGVAAEQNVDDGSPGTNSVRYAGGHFGVANPPAAGANTTNLHDMNWAAAPASGAAVGRETTAGQGSRPVGYTAASDDLAVVHLAVREAAAGGAVKPKALLTLGVG